LRPKKQTLKTKLQSKAKGVVSNVKKTTGQTINKGNQLLQNARLRIKSPNATPTKANALKMNRYMQPNVQGGKGILNAFGLQGGNWLADQLVDRSFRGLSGNNNIPLDQYRAMRDKALASGPSKVGTNQQIQPTVTRNRRGRVTDTKQPVGRNWQNPYMGPSQPEIKQETPIKKKKSTTNYVQTPSPTWGEKDKPKEKLKSTKVTKKEKNKKKESLKIKGKLPSSIQKRLLKAGFTVKELETLMDKHTKWKKDRGR
jgi:hypothetical protein